MKTFSIFEIASFSEDFPDLMGEEGSQTTGCFKNFLLGLTAKFEEWSCAVFVFFTIACLRLCQAMSFWLLLFSLLSQHLCEYSVVKTLKLKSLVTLIETY